MGHEHTETTEDRLYYFEDQEVTIPDFQTPGFILDIGGGGEGIIGRLKGNQVIAVDPNRRELEEAATGPLKVVMDATDLRFLDHSFSAATSFFTLMYIDGSDHPKVFDEVFRVLTSGGPFFVWDACLPQRLDTEKDIAVLPLVVRLPHEEITTGYGAAWPDKEQDLDHYLRLAEQAGFEVVEGRETDRVLFLHLRKP